MSWFLTVALLVPTADRTWTALPESGTVRPVRAADGADFPARFRLGTEEFSFAAKPEYEHAAIRKYSVTFPSPVTTPHPLNNTVHAEYSNRRGPGRILASSCCTSWAAIFRCRVWSPIIWPSVAWPPSS